MSIIVKILKQLENDYFEQQILPSNLQIKHLVFLENSILSVIGVLKPEENVNQFFFESHFKNHIRKFLPNIPSVRTEIFIFLINYEGEIFMTIYHPLAPISILRYEKDSNNIEHGFVSWLTKFSINFVTRDNILKGDKETFYNFIKMLPNNEIKDELTIISSLCSLQYH